MKKFIHAIRSKPKHVRQRMLVVCMIVITPILLAGGVLAFIYERNRDQRGDSSVWDGLLDVVSSSTDFMIESE